VPVDDDLLWAEHWEMGEKPIAVGIAASQQVELRWRFRRKMINQIGR